jgi:hypothetical protein
MLRNIRKDMAGIRTFAVERRTCSAGLLLLALCVMTIGATNAARADIIQIAAVAFANRTTSTNVGDPNFGMLSNATGTFFAAVPFLTHGDNVCKFDLVYRDNDTDFGITAKLMKKRIQIGNTPFVPAVTIARVVTGNAAAAAGVQRRSDATINQPTIDLVRGFYYVELTVPATTLEVLGVQIDVRPTC